MLVTSEEPLVSVPANPLTKTHNYSKQHDNKKIQYLKFVICVFL